MRKNVKYTSKKGEEKVFCKKCHKVYATWEIATTWDMKVTTEACDVCGK